MTTPLQDQLATIERELAALDLEGARERLRSAEAELANTPFGGEQATDRVAPNSPPGNYQSDDQVRASGRVKNARANLSRLEARAVDLRREAEGITRLLSAGRRIEQAQDAVQRAQETADASAAELAGAKATCDRLGKAVEAEKSEATAAAAASADAMLQAARIGGDASTVPVRPDKLAPLQAALASAEAERDRIGRLHAADQSAVAAAQARVREAEADVSQGEYAAAEIAFIALAAQHVATMVRAGRSAPGFMHVHSRVHAAAQAVEQEQQAEALRSLGTAQPQVTT